MNLLAIILGFTLISMASYFIYLNKSVNISKKYNTKYAVITGANGGLGRAETIKLLKQINIIAIGRKENELR